MSIDMERAQKLPKTVMIFKSRYGSIYVCYGDRMLCDVNELVNDKGLMQKLDN